MDKDSLAQEKMEAHGIEISVENEYLEEIFIKCHKIECKNNVIYADGVEIDFNNINPKYATAMVVSAIDGKSV